MLYHGKSGGVAVSVDGSAPVGEAQAAKELASQLAGFQSALKTAAEPMPANDLTVGQSGTTTAAVQKKDNINTIGWQSLATGTFAMTYWWSTSGKTTEADIGFSKSTNWYAGSGTPTSPKVDLASLMTHELGHAVGLAHETTTPKQVMYPYFSAGENRREKRMGDGVGIATLY
ncbi:MAG: matrixin family metalloprotease [Propionicimonas sp.]|uniref:matrixin family metalloprotease n=1 Tax=Propionicimonas sp. TaxID=1955623 RepID=UPI002B21CE26|nr:matrixin family metalloprotease [Propionicimonas sp.]MEA4942878.1 matrixin family metalloprotease [Propionicimonas sp.]MEA5051965.1 matrixin family metalloprotease [Propionicimonas sp.]MEA5118996.1 matrixin family metalloprotease [Propionicimonas sp.]